MKIRAAATALALVLAPLVTGAGTAARYPLHHRFVPPSVSDRPTPGWTAYGNITIDYDGAYPQGSFEKDPGPNGADVDYGRGWYQLGLKVQDEVLVTSTKSCYTAAPQVYDFVLHLPSADRAALPIGITLDISTHPSGACPRGWYDDGDRLFLPKGINTQVSFRVPQTIQPLVLQAPPSVDPNTGKEAEPPVEKSFLQKYWLPLAGIAFFLLSQAAPQPEAPRQAAE